MTPSAIGRIAGPAALLLLAALAMPSPVLAQQGPGGEGPLPNPLAPKATGPQPTLAPEEEGGPPPPPNTQEPMEEITVIAPRRVMPDFQTVDEFHRAEFEAIRGEYEKAAPPPPRAYEVFEMGSSIDRKSVV